MIQHTLTRRHILCILCFSPFLYAQTIDNERVWQDFLEWLKHTPLEPDSEWFEIPLKYREKLIADGFSAEQVAQHMSVINEYMLSRTEGMKVFFDDVFTSRNDFFDRNPSVFLAQVIQAMKPGTALDVSMGQGRNSIYLAQKGWDVTGFDISDEGLTIAQQNAKKAGVKIKTVLSGYQDFDFGKNRWDLVAMIYAFFPIRTEVYVRKLIDSIRPGGVLVFEHYLFVADAPVQRNTAGMVGVPSPNELLKIFGDFRILRYDESSIVPEWGEGKPEQIVRMLAQKKQ